ncbi:MAG: hypothetical protein M3245_06635 [Actinomycetota bacterium]|nr:hypothetical protein [Actinomycetota bacterium]
MADRKVQLYLTEEQYRFVKQRAAERGSIAQVVRDLIDEAGRPNDPRSDPFYQHLIETKKGSGRSYDAESAKRELYGRPG